MPGFDVIVTGSGASGQTVVSACAKAGKRVAVIDRAPLGGTCALRGCQPKKLLVAAADAVVRANALGAKGVSGVAQLDWPSLQASRHALVDPVPERTAKWMAKAGVTIVAGSARFVAHDTLEVDGESYTAPAIVIATGARPADLPIEGAEHLTTSTEFLGLPSMPASLVFVGGGYISFEFAWLAKTAGAAVTIVHSSDRALEGFDAQLAEMLVRHYRDMGVTVLLDAPVERINRLDDSTLTVNTPSTILTADLAVHGAGRVPDIADLDLDAANVEHGPEGVTVDDHLRSTTNPLVWAIGDAAALGAPLTPVAGEQGEVVAANILGGDMCFDGAVTPSVVFSSPVLARVGIAADYDDSDTDVAFHDMSEWFQQTHVGNRTSGAVLVSDKRTGVLLGAHLLAVHAEETINTFALAIKAGMTIGDLRSMTWSYPTLTYDINYLTGRW